MVEHLPSKCRVLGSVLSFRKKTKPDAAFLWLKVKQMKILASWDPIFYILRPKLLMASLKRKSLRSLLPPQVTSSKMTS